MGVETKLDTGRGSRTLVSRLGETLRQAIATGQFPPGSRLPSEAQLTEAHGVSRTVVREAIASLRADRLVEARQGAGVFVLEPSSAVQPVMLSLSNIDLARVSSMIELLELRTAVEVEAAGLAAIAARRRRKKLSSIATMRFEPVSRRQNRPARRILPCIWRSRKRPTIPDSVSS